MGRYNYGKAASIMVDKNIELEKYTDEIALLTNQEPDPTSLLLLKGHALIDVWLERYVDYINDLKQVSSDNPKLRVLASELQLLFTTPHPQIDVTKGFMGKLIELKKLRIFAEDLDIALERLNKYRNIYTHNFDSRIKRSQIESILQSLLRRDKIKKLYNKKCGLLSDDTELLHFVFAHMLSRILMQYVMLKEIRKILQ